MGNFGINEGGKCIYLMKMYMYMFYAFIILVFDLKIY